MSVADESAVLELREVGKSYRTSVGRVDALSEVDLTVGRGEFVVVRGPSGSGKSTLLMALGGLLRPDSGRMSVLDRDLYAMGPCARSTFRAQRVGVVFQMFHLVPYLDALGNVLMGPGNLGRPDRASEARSWLDRLGLADRLHHRPDQLSVGQCQRVAVARALLPGPDLVLADEPTGNLDPENTRIVIDELVRFQDGGGTVVVVTHGLEADAHATRILRLDHGRLQPA